MAAKGRHTRFLSHRLSSWKLFFPIFIIFSFVILIIVHRLSLLITSRDSTKAHDLSSIVHNSVNKRNDRYDDNDNESRDPWIEVISWKPRAAVYHNFLSKDECEYLINLAKPHMTNSTVVDENTGESIYGRERTSTGTFLERGQDKTVSDIEERLADFTFIPVEHGEGLQILHYEVGQKYEPHHDYFDKEFNQDDGGNRVATVLMYLSNVEEGGETVFPEAEGNISSVPWWNELSECGKGGLSVKPKMGDALLFWSINPDGTFDSSSVHGGCPVIKGNKWSSTKWLHFNELKD